MATLDTMVMAGKEAPSEEPVPLVCPHCRGRDVEETTLGFKRGTRDPNRSTCRNKGCRAHGVPSDWRLIESLRRYVARVVLDVEPLASQP